MPTTMTVDRSRGKDFTGLTIMYEGRMYVYAGKTAEAILAAADQHAANHIIKLQQSHNGICGESDYVRPEHIRENSTDYAIKLRNGEL